ncbi:MAG: SDR family NAD(P)-dependent oxidoreductase, partial [Methylobacteriaceae bacterium]
MGHKPLNEQVIVITGASSGIGLATARMAARRGARVVLAARSEDVLADIAAEFGTRATYVVADVGRREDVQAIADHAVATFGGFDTWVNVA